MENVVAVAAVVGKICVPSGEIEKKTDRWGGEYYELLPSGWRLAGLDDFHLNGRLKIGMEFLIRWADNVNHYQVCIVSRNLKGAWLLPFITAERVFVKS